MRALAPTPMALIALGALGVVLLALVMPGLYLRLLPLFAVAAIGLAAWEFPFPALLAIYALVPLNLESNLGLSPSTVVAAQKAGAIAMSALLVVKRGFSGQVNGVAFALVLAALPAPLLGQAHPGNGVGEMVRSLLGSLAPFAVIFVRFDRRWIDRALILVVASPFIAVLAGVPLQAAGIRSMMASDQTGVIRLQGATIPAFLGYLGAIATMAAFTEYAQRGNWRWLVAAGGALLCTVASGTRVPSACAVLFCAIVLTFGAGENFGRVQRMRLWILGGAALFAVAAVVGPIFIQRSMNLGGRRGIQASGRDVIWPIYAAAVERFPMFGQGVGTYRVLVDPDDVRWLGTLAAHNEYLRLAADIGVLGVLAVVAGHVVWLRAAWAWLRPLDRVVLLAFGLVFLLYSITDNTLISPPAMTVYLWLAVQLERARCRAEDEGRMRRRRAPLARMQAGSLV